MTSSIPVSEELLKSAFCVAEQQLRGNQNYTLTRKITNEVGRVYYEHSMDAIFASTLRQTFPLCSVRHEFNGIDIGVMHEDAIVTAIETKAMVANSHSGDMNRISIDLHGIRTKLYPDKRASNSIQTDIAGISSKIPPGMACPRFELFIPVVYELYRGGGSESDWFAERKPWVTLPRFKALREDMKDDLAQWFQREDPMIRLIHAAESVELRDANEMWLQQSRRKFPNFTSLEAYVSFYAFARFVE